MITFFSLIWLTVQQVIIDDGQNQHQVLLSDIHLQENQI